MPEPCRDAAACSVAAPPPQFRTIDGSSDVGFDDFAANGQQPVTHEVTIGQADFEPTSAAVDSAFNALAQTVLVQNARTLEDLVREMLRPMLKTWLDDNLPGMVERLVRAEIERVSRGRGGLNFRIPKRMTTTGCAQVNRVGLPGQAIRPNALARRLLAFSAAASLAACSARTAGSSLTLAGGFKATPFLRGMT